jgi:hypothetical protein
MAVDYYDNAGRSKLNSAYRRRGDVKWLGVDLKGLAPEERSAAEAMGGQLSGLWNLMRVSEGN